MDSLPPEIKLNFFNQLSIRDSIKCRQVCKDWLAIIDCLRYKSLDFHVAYCERSELKNSYETDIDLWILNFEKFFRSVTIDPKFSRIKVMNATGYLWEVENLDVFINHFHGLEELNLFSVPDKFALNLKFLKKLFLFGPENEVKLETPSLTHLITEELSNFEICYPEKIKYLEVYNTSSLTQLKNLEVLIVIDYSDIENTIRQLSADLHRSPKLKRVYIGYQCENFDKKLDQIPIHRNSDLQVYYYGFRIYSDLFGNFDLTNIKNLNEPNVNILEWTSFMARNYSTSMDDKPYHFDLDYNRLLDEFDQNIPSDFLKKISKFDSIKIKNLDDEMKILKFLESAKPRDVVIKNPTLSRSFLEQLSKFSFIDILRINIDEWPAFLDDFNFDFKNEEIYLEFQIRCSIKSLRPMFEVVKKAKSISLELFGDEFRFYLNNRSLENLDFTIDYTLNGKPIFTYCTVESLDFCFYLDRQVPSIVEWEDKLRLFCMVEEYEAQKTIAKKVIRKLYRNPTISIKF